MTSSMVAGWKRHDFRPVNSGKAGVLQRRTNDLPYRPIYCPSVHPTTILTARPLSYHPSRH